MNIKTAITILSVLLMKVGSAQLHIGFYHDMDLLPIVDYVSPFEYSPETKLTLSYYSDSFEKGTVYNADGSKRDGLVKYKNKKIWFKESGATDNVKLRPEDVRGLTIGLDSFFVATNFNVEKKVGASFQSTPQFMQYLTTFEDKIFAKHYFFSSGMAQQYAMASPVIETYQVRTNGGQWKSFPRRKNEFKQMALAYFGHIPYLKKRIEDGTIGFEDVNGLIKTAQYLSYYQNDEMIHFDRFWNETDDAENSTFQVKIQSLTNDSIWTFNYFKDQKPIYQARYSALFPHKKHGNFVILGKDGFPIQVTEYKKNEPSNRTVTFPDGTPHYKQHFREYGREGFEKTLLTYLDINAPSGSSLLEETNATEKVAYKQGEFTNTFVRRRLVSSYREAEGHKIYQVLDPEYNFKKKKMQNLLSTHFEGVKFRNEVEQHVQGKYLISILISDKGKVVDMEIHNSLLPALDEKIKRWANQKLGAEYYGLKFKPYRVDGEKVYAEFVVPLEFNVVKFYRKPANYYYDWHMHHMMFQQQMMQPMNLPSPPPMPRF